jgi:hypothetical protein
LAELWKEEEVSDARRREEGEERKNELLGLLGLVSEGVDTSGSTVGEGSTGVTLSDLLVSLLRGSRDELLGRLDNLWQKKREGLAPHAPHESAREQAHVVGGVRDL